MSRASVVAICCAGLLTLTSCVSSDAVTPVASAPPPSASAATPSTVVAATTPTTTPAAATTTLPKAPPAATQVAYDNTLALRACTLLDPAEIQAQFGAPAAAGVPIFPYCWWKVGTNGFVSLTVLDKKPLSTYRAYRGLAVGEVKDLGDGAFLASNKTLFVGVGTTTYVVQFERGAEWVDSNQPKLRALAQTMLDRLGFVAPPKPPPTTVAPPPDPEAPPIEPPPPTTTTTTAPRPRPPLVAAPVALVRPTAPIDVSRALTAAAPLKVWVGGDSIAGGPAWAMGEATGATGVARADTEFQVGTGLSRPDFFDWYRHLIAVADARDPEVMILLFGGNDIQPLELPNGGSASYGQPAWADEYRRRVSLIQDGLAVRGRRVIWVGTPPMSDPGFSAQMAALNGIYRSEAEKHAPWVTYFDAWTFFSPAGQPGTFARELPDANGVPQKVRFDDIHYDVHGSEVLAAALMGVLRTFTKIP